MNMDLHDAYRLFRENKITRRMFIHVIEALTEQKADDLNLTFKSNCKVCTCINCTLEKLCENQRQIETIKHFMGKVKHRDWNLDSAMQQLLTEFKQAERCEEFRHSHWTGVKHEFVRDIEVEE